MGIDFDKEIQELKSKKEKTKKKYIGNIIYFSVSVSILMFFIVFSLYYYKIIDSKTSDILLITLSLIIPCFSCCFLIVCVTKEKLLKAINGFYCSNQFIINFLLGLLLWIFAYYQSKKIEDVNTLLTIYSISWAAFGISVTIIGVWFSINANLIFDLVKRDDSPSFQKTFLPVGTISVSLSVLLNLIILLFSVSHISNGTAIDNSSFFVAGLFVSAHTVLDVITFILVPVISSAIFTIKNENIEMVGFCNTLIELTEQTKQLKEKTDAITKSVDTTKETEDCNKSSENGEK